MTAPLVTLRRLRPDDRDRLLAWRNAPEVAAYMYSDHEITAEEHARWFAGIAGDPTPFIVATLAYLFCGVAFGTLVGVAIPSQAAAMQAVQLGGFLLAFLLSGLIFPVENIPAGLRWISNVIQARYYIVVVRDAFLQGAGWAAMWWQIPPIAAIGLVFYALAWRTTRRMQVNA